MKRAQRWVAGGWLAGLIALGGCGGDTSAQFICAADGVQRDCTPDAQYCEIVTESGSNTVNCRTVPSTCTNPAEVCACLLAPLAAHGATQPSCTSLAVGGGRQTTLYYSQ